MGESVKAMIDYIYTNETDTTSEEILIDLLKLADKYNITSLLSYSSAALSKIISLENCVRMWCMAKAFNAKELKDFHTRFIAKRYMMVSKQESWHKTLKEDPDIVTEVLCALAED